MKKYTPVLNMAADKATAEILIHGPIGRSFWSEDGITGKEFTDALNEIPAGTKITVGVNSQGGSIGEGLAIYNAIQRRSADITARNDGYMLSIASVFPLAAAKVVSPKSAVWMIHRGWNESVGNAADHRRNADMLETHDEVMAQIYAKKTGKSQKAMMEAMDEETWMTGEEAAAFGMCDEMSEEDVSKSQEALDFNGMDSNTFKNPEGMFMTHADFPGLPMKDFAILTKKIKNFFAMDTQKWKESLHTAAVAGAGNRNQTPQHMTTKSIVALLKRHGIEATETETEAELQAKLDKISPPSTEPNKDILALSQALVAEKRARVTASVKAAAANKIDNDKLDWWVNLAMNDEAGTLAQINAMPIRQPGTEPVSGGYVVEGKNTYADILKLPTAKERHNALLSDWDNLIQDAFARDGRGEKCNVSRPTKGASRTAPQATNTFSGTITTSFLLDGAITTLQNRWAPLMVFTRDFSTDPYKPKATHVLKHYTAAGSTVTDPTDWQQGGDTVAALSVTMNQYSQQFSVTNAQLNSGFRLLQALEINTAYLANKIIEVATAPITVANYETTGGQTSLVSAPGAFGFSDLATLWGQLKKSPIKNILLDGEYLARIINTPTFYQVAGKQPGGGWSAFGWDYIALNTDWTGAGTSVRGFACNPQAIVAVAGLPLTPPQGIPGNTLQISTETVPEVNVSIMAGSWFALQSRTAWMALDLMFGASVADTTAGVLIKSQ